MERLTPLKKSSFNDDQLSIAAFLDGRDRNPHLLLRVLNKDPGVQPFFSIRGVHELVIERDASSLRLMRWSYGEQCAKLWAQLFFQTWEGMKCPMSPETPWPDRQSHMS